MNEKNRYHLIHVHLSIIFASTVALATPLAKKTYWFETFFDCPLSLSSCNAQLELQDQDQDQHSLQLLLHLQHHKINFNTNKSIIDFCKPKLTKPNDAFTVYSNGIFEYLKDRKQIFDFDFASDVQKSLELKTYIESCEYTDDSLHPDQYKPYELFLDHVMANKK